MKAKFRQVYVYNVDVEAIRKNAVMPSMSDLVSIFDKHRLAGAAKISVQSGDIEVMIGDISVDQMNNTAVLLVRHNDKHSADSVYSNFITNSFTAHPKAQGEAGEVGAHVFISLLPERQTPNRYTCIVEKVPGVDVGLIRRLLNSVMSNEYSSNPQSFSYPSPTGARTRAGTVRMERCAPRLEFSGQPSQTLANDIQRGRLTGITLSRSEPKTPVGGVPYITKREAFLKLEIDHGSITSNLWGDIKRALHAESGTFPQAQIGLRLPNRSKTVSVNVDSQTGNPIDQLYIKSFDIDNISPPMAQSALGVVPQLSVRVLPLLLQERDV